MIIVRKPSPEEWEDALANAGVTLMEEYGIEKDTVNILLHYIGIHAKDITAYAAYEDEEWQGLMVCDANKHQIYLTSGKTLDAAKSLLEALCNDTLEYRILVSSPSKQVPFYESLGFEAEGEAVSYGTGSTVPMEYILAKRYLGQKVHVTVEATYGSFHPQFADTQYPCNYGYVEEILKESGEYVNAYVYGINEPIDTFQGVIIAVIYRKETDQPIVVVSKETTYNRQDVINTVGEIEQYYQTKMIWL